jgi:SAM-dependent methyltransferase
MSGFDPAWLALREPYDHAARSEALTAAFAEALGARATESGPLLLDLGAGSGSNLRYLAPRLPARQRWLAADHDPVLLDHLTRSAAGLGIVLEPLRLDLARELDRLPFAEVSGVTASALLDLTSAAWLEAFAARCQDLPVLMALSFDGRLDWQPAEPLDGDLRRLFLRHQQGDKGFGPAEGAAAAAWRAVRRRAQGVEVRRERSDWRFAAGDRAILEAKIEGVVTAALELEPGLDLAPWRERRLEQAATGRLALTVGHLDLLALPGG